MNNINEYIVRVYCEFKAHKVTKHTKLTNQSLRNRLILWKQEKQNIETK